jgi:hypothetical protein
MDWQVLVWIKSPTAVIADRFKDTRTALIGHLFGQQDFLVDVWGYAYEMANPEHMAKLTGPFSAWRKWRQENPDLTLDFREAHLREAYLEGADLRRANVGGADLRRANLGGAYLGEADLRSANLERAYLRSANLAGADLGRANLSGADLREAYFDGADLRGANLSGTYLFNAKRLTQEQIDEAYGDSTTELPADLHVPESWKK